MARKTGITATTPNKMFFGAGILSVGTVSVGATSGPATFTVTQEKVFPQLNGSAGDVAATGWVKTEVARLKVRVAEITMKNIAYGVPGLRYGSSTTSEITLASSVGCIAASQYKAVVFTAEDCQGNDIIITLNNAMMMSDLSMDFSDDENTMFDLEFECTYALATPTARPWSIKIETS